MKKIDLVGYTKKIHFIPILIVLIMASNGVRVIANMMYDSKIDKIQGNTIDTKNKEISKNKTSLDKLEVDTKTHLDELKCLQEKVEHLFD
jgi:flagellar basal body-associated protein FliL